MDCRLSQFFGESVGYLPLNPNDLSDLTITTEDTKEVGLAGLMHPWSAYTTQ